jgi:DNA-binding GntR family transcriptional regulator
MTRVEARALYLAAGALEGVVAREAASRTSPERKALGQRLMKAEDTFEREAKKRAPDWDRLFDLHNEFHRILVDALAGPRLRVLLDGLRPHLDRYEYAYGPMLAPGYDATFEEHAAIARAVADGTADDAERVVRANWFRGGARLEEVIGRVGETGLLRQLGALSSPI